MSATFSAADYAGAMRRLMPPGAVWSLDPGSVQGRTLGALAQGLERLDAAAVQLLVDAFPATTDALLPEWEASLGLPDPAMEAASVDQHRAQVATRLIGAGGQSRARFIDFAGTLGFTITITNYAPARAGQATAGSPAYSQVWGDTWGVHIVSNTGGLSAAVLLAELNAIKPAESHIILI